MSTARRYTSADLDRLPDVEGVRYEIIEGELHVSKQPSWHHQYTTGKICGVLEIWNDESGIGVTIPAPGVIFSTENDVIPDVAWISRERLALLEDQAGHLTGAPELVVEVLSPGAANERRDRELKLGVYSRQGVEEYWIVDWRMRTLEIFRRMEDALRPVATLTDDDILTSPLLSGFACPISRLWPPSLP